MLRKQLWMRLGARVLANGQPGEIVSIWSHTDDGVESVNYIDVCLDGKDEVEFFSPHAIQRDRIQREVCYVS